MNVNVFGDFGVGVTKQVRHDFNFTSIVEEHRCEGVSQGMKSNSFNADGRKYRGEGSSKSRRSDSFTIRRCDDVFEFSSDFL